VILSVIARHDSRRSPFGAAREIALDEAKNSISANGFSTRATYLHGRRDESPRRTDPASGAHSGRGDGRAAPELRYRHDASAGAYRQFFYEPDRRLQVWTHVHDRPEKLEALRHVLAQGADRVPAGTQRLISVHAAKTRPVEAT
jgi:hypothetical protein